MKRETFTFFSGVFAALAFAHAVYAMLTTRGLIAETVFLGRRWGVGFMWTEAGVYSAISVALGYLGWSTNRSAPQQVSAPAASSAPAESAAGRRTDPHLVGR